MERYLWSTKDKSYRHKTLKNYRKQKVVYVLQHGIVFKITINPSISSAPFVVTDKVSFFTEEEKVLFSIHTVFRIDEIKIIDNNDRLCQVELKLTADNDSQLRRLTEQIHKETFPTTKGWYRMGELLIKLGQFDKAPQVFSVILKQTTADKEKSYIYHQLGRINDEQGEYQEALEIFEKILPSNHPDLTNSYNNIVMVYNHMGEYSKGISFHERGGGIGQSALPANHPQLQMYSENLDICRRKL